jgi:hypothetical protein
MITIFNMCNIGTLSSSRDKSQQTMYTNTTQDEQQTKHKMQLKKSSKPVMPIMLPVFVPVPITFFGRAPSTIIFLIKMKQYQSASQKTKYVCPL